MGTYKTKWVVAVFVLTLIFDVYFVWVRRRYRRFSQENINPDESEQLLKWRVLLMSMFSKKINQLFKNIPKFSVIRKKLFAHVWQKMGGLLFATLMILVGLFLMRSGKLAAGTIVVTIAIVLFLLVSRTLKKDSITEEDLIAVKMKIIPLICGLAAFFLAAITIINVASSQSSGILKPGSGTFSWVLSIVFLATSVLWFEGWKPPSKNEILHWFKANIQEILLVTGIVVVGLVIRAYMIYDHPYPWSGDEASVGTEGYRILTGKISSLFATGWSGQPYLSFVPTTFSLLLWGQNILAIRMVSAVIGTVSIVGLYLLGREIYNRQVAIVAATFLAFFPYHVHFSRVGVNNIMDCLFVTLMLWFLFRAVRRGNFRDYVWVGFATGMAIYSYVGSRLVIALAVASFLYIIIRTKGYLRAYWQQLIMFLLGTVFVIAPIGYYFLKFPGNFMTRIGQENIFLSGWLMREAQRAEKSIVAIFVEQASKTLAVFVAKEAHGNFFNSPEPYLTILGSFFFLIGMGYLIQQFFKPRNFSLMMWFWSVVILGGILTPSPPANARMIMSSPAIALIVALGVWRISEILRHLSVKERWVKGMVIVVIAIIATQNTFFYFVTYRQGHYFQDANSELAMEVGLELQQLGPEYDFYLLGVPRVFAGFPTIVFLAPDNEKIDLREDFFDQIKRTPEEGQFFVAIPENLSDLETIAHEYSGGTWSEMPRKTKSEVLYYAYTLPPTQ